MYETYIKTGYRLESICEKIEVLFDKYKTVQISTMGFPENWKELLQ